MNNTLLKRWLIALVILTAFSCNKMLDIKPADQVDGGDIFKSVTTLNKAVLGVYADWREEYAFRIGSVMADECRIGPDNAGVNGSAQHLFRWTFSGADTEISDMWSNAYQVINRANRLLEGIDQVPANSSDDQQQKQQLKGELLAIRAFEHFELYRSFAAAGVYQAGALAVPYVTNSHIDNKPSRPAAADFFKALQDDITAALPLLSNNNDVIRMGRQAALALQARVALYTGNWAMAAESATTVIAAAPLAGNDAFPAIWTDQRNDEVIFKLKRTNQSSFRPGDVWYNAAMNILYFQPSLKLLQSYDAINDVRYSAYFRGDTISKYQGAPGAVNLNDVKVFRTGELYLIRAEAMARQGNLTAALADLNTLRAARIKGIEPVVAHDTEQLLKAVMDERFRELPFEGHRYFDLKRLGWPVEREDQTVLAPGSQYYFLPIPQAEVLANPNIKPNNPGW
ncbi:RagB/SusD family nutrient uptake outer membrane protein [Chitinophaga vietnamensis]|uniref:RagB/SusD family nutrient uptake outer membrane protein n=1 Tax=Chitinophaga vietnamensis TaxID=2593957 RepID=UPI001178CAA4|nr:RagB/SusD family nutrient uptake outer membrane protein [Chitinophaga vietnamensis]